MISADFQRGWDSTFVPGSGSECRLQKHEDQDRQEEVVRTERRVEESLRFSHGETDGDCCEVQGGWYCQY